LKTKRLGNTDLEITRIGLGTWAIGGGDWQFGWGPQDDKDSIQTIYKAFDVGINWIDTAAVYGLGHSEEMVGKAIKGMQDQPIVATKCARNWDQDGTILKILKKDSIKAECEASLRRLDVEVIDLYQIHWPEPDEDIEEGWEAIGELIDEGKVRWGGVSNFSVTQMERIRPIHPISSLQPPYSMIVPHIEQTVLPYCAEHNIGVICYSPMYKGLLTGRLTRERLATLPESDHRSRDAHLKEPELTANLALVAGLQTIAEREGRSMSDIAIAWTLRRPEVTTAIVGARHPNQIQETARLGDWALSDAIIEEIDGLLNRRAEALRTI
jgi:aryl-alcohol dehydrogenase-like predicted oxidoreductase